MSNQGRPCPECNTKNPAVNQFCRVCGAPLVDAGAAQQVATPALSPVERPRKPMPYWLAAVGIIVVVGCVLLAIAGALLWTSSDGATPTSAAEAKTTQIPATSQASGGLPTPFPSPTPPTANPVLTGMSRSRPHPRSAFVSAPGWDIQVLEILRGETAWLAIQAASAFNDPPPEGMEYLLVKLYARCTYDDREEHHISQTDFEVTGDNLTRYSTALVLEPVPRLDATLSSGAATEGWAAYPVKEGESNLILVFDEVRSLQQDGAHYIALDEGASIDIPPELAETEPTDLGRERSSPARLGETVVCQDWEVTVLNVVRGDEAWAMVQAANELNDRPEGGMEYAAVRVRARYVHPGEQSAPINILCFESIGSTNTLHRAPLVVEPAPPLDCVLYPGGVCEGWVTLQAARGETDLVAVFEPLLSLSERDRRFLALEP